MEAWTFYRLIPTWLTGWRSWMDGRMEGWMEGWGAGTDWLVGFDRASEGASMDDLLPVTYGWHWRSGIFLAGFYAGTRRFISLPLAWGGLCGIFGIENGGVLGQDYWYWSRRDSKLACLRGVWTIYVYVPRYWLEGSSGWVYTNKRWVILNCVFCLHRKCEREG